VKVRLGLEFGI